MNLLTEHSPIFYFGLLFHVWLSVHGKVSGDIGFLQNGARSSKYLSSFASAVDIPGSAPISNDFINKDTASLPVSQRTNFLDVSDTPESKDFKWKGTTSEIPIGSSIANPFSTTNSLGKLLDENHLNREVSTIPSTQDKDSLTVAETRSSSLSSDVINSDGDDVKEITQESKIKKTLDSIKVKVKKSDSENADIRVYKLKEKKYRNDDSEKLESSTETVVTNSTKGLPVTEFAKSKITKFVDPGQVTTTDPGSFRTGKFRDTNKVWGVTNRYVNRESNTRRDIPLHYFDDGAENIRADTKFQYGQRKPQGFVLTTESPSETETFKRIIPNRSTQPISFNYKTRYGETTETFRIPTTAATAESRNNRPTTAASLRRRYPSQGSFLEQPLPTVSAVWALAGMKSPNGENHVKKPSYTSQLVDVKKVIPTSLKPFVPWSTRLQKLTAEESATETTVFDDEFQTTVSYVTELEHVVVNSTSSPDSERASSSESPVTYSHIVTTTVNVPLHRNKNTTLELERITEEEGKVDDNEQNGNISSHINLNNKNYTVTVTKVEESKLVHVMSDNRSNVILNKLNDTNEENTTVQMASTVPENVTYQINDKNDQNVNVLTNNTLEQLPVSSTTVSDNVTVLNNKAEGNTTLSNAMESNNIEIYARNISLTTDSSVVNAHASTQILESMKHNNENPPAEHLDKHLDVDIKPDIVTLEQSKILYPLSEEELNETGINVPDSLSDNKYLYNNFDDVQEHVNTVFKFEKHDNLEEHMKEENSKKAEKIGNFNNSATVLNSTLILMSNTSDITSNDVTSATIHSAVLHSSDKNTTVAHLDEVYDRNITNDILSVPVTVSVTSIINNTVTSDNTADLPITFNTSNIMVVTTGTTTVTSTTIGPPITAASSITVTVSTTSATSVYVNFTASAVNVTEIATSPSDTNVTASPTDEDKFTFQLPPWKDIIRHPTEQTAATSSSTPGPTTVLSVSDKRFICNFSISAENLDLCILEPIDPSMKRESATDTPVINSTTLSTTGKPTDSSTPPTQKVYSSSESSTPVAVEKNSSISSNNDSHSNIKHSTEQPLDDPFGVGDTGSKSGPRNTIFDPLNPPHVPGYLILVFKTSAAEVCKSPSLLKESLFQFITSRTYRIQSRDQIIMVVDPEYCKDPDNAPKLIPVALYILDGFGEFDQSLMTELKHLLEAGGNSNLSSSIHEVVYHENVLPDNARLIAVIIISCIAAVCSVLLVILLLLIRNRHMLNYGQRCTPVSIDDYSLDNISYNSYRRKSALRASKRSYGNPAFDDPVAPSRSLTYANLIKASEDRPSIDEEFSMIPVVVAKPDELPPRAEVKNRYANVIPLPETRVSLSSAPTNANNNESVENYINANYVKGARGAEKFYIACQAPLQSTVEDFWKMIWKEQSKVIIMLTALVENGVEKCANYLPPSEVLDCHRLFGDYQVTLKKRDVRENYVISSLQLKNMEINLWREVTHIWYTSWPSQGVPKEHTSIISMLLEARGHMRNAPGPHVVHCSPGTGRTGTIIAVDICMREYELTKCVNIPAIVSMIRHCRAGSVQTKEQYAFIYRILASYGKKLHGGSASLDSF